MMKSTNMTESRHHSNKQQPTLVGASVNDRTSIGLCSYEEQPTLVRALYHHTTGIARRALLFLTFFVACVGSVWGEEIVLWDSGESQAIIESSEMPDAFNTSEIILRVYVTPSSLGTMYIATYPGYSKFLSSDRYTKDDPEWNPEGYFEFELSLALASKLKEEGLIVSDVQTTKITYELPAQDDFNGNYFENEPTPITYVIESVAETIATITFNPTISNTKYARFYLERNGTTQEISSSALTLSSGEGQTSNEWPKRGIYVYKANGLTAEDLTVTVSLEAGTFPEYQLVAYFSDEAPTLKGTTITKEPINLKEKQIYSFSYPVKTIDKYFEWDKTSIEINLVEYLRDDFPTLLDDGLEKGYIGWAIHNGPYGVGSPIDVHSNQNEWPHTYWAIILPNGFEIDNPKDYRWSDYLKTTIYTPEPQKFSDYPDYVIVCEVSDESKNNIKVRYIFHFNEDGKVPFPGKLIGEQDGMTQKVDRSAESVPLDLTNGAFKHEKLTNGAKYARFYVIDSNGNLVEPTELTVTYDGDNATSCTKSEQGYYIYQVDNGLDLSKISAKYANPQNYKSYQVVGVFATNMETAIIENGTLTREPDWDLQYIYSFTYSVDETKQFFKTVEWTRTGMIPEASVDDPNTDWNISWEELAAEQYVKWYVVDAEGKVQPLVSGGKATDGAWTITASAYTVAEDVAVLTGQSAFFWNTWGSPTIYAPADVDYETVKNYQIICEIYSNSTGEGKPNAKYTFAFQKKFLGELKVDDDSHQGGETIVVGVDATNLTIPLSKAQQAYNDLDWSGTLKYVRVWLTTLSGIPIDPTGKLTISGMEQYQTAGNRNVTYGYYLTNGINLSEATLTLDAETYNQYQVHVAFSTDNLTDTFEPDYDYVYTFSFNYAMKIVHKVLLYDSTNRTCIPNLLGYSTDLSIDCDVDRETLQQKLYVRWYLIDEDGNVISDSFGFNGDGYSQAGGKQGYYRKGNFSFPSYRRYEDEQPNTSNYPTITLPNEYDYKKVHIVCAATTKTDDYDDSPWNGDPREIQVKYVYTLYTENDVKKQPFVHYQGEAYRYLMEEKGDIDGAKQRDYIKMGGKTPEENYTWNIFTNCKELTTNNIRQGVHTWEYDLYFIPGSDPQKLVLPFQNYTDGDKKGQDQEPQAYIRWYDWNTDKKVESDGTFVFDGMGEWLVEDDKGRGLFYIYKEKKNLWHGNIGVTFEPKANFSETIDIACDVSKYSDGMVEIDGTYYLLHEPTLSTRYIFHIHPASEMADRLEKAKQKMEVAENTGSAETLFDAMSELEEDKGKVIVSLGKNMKGDFSLRFDQPDYANYILKKGSVYVPAVVSAAQWYAYYEDNGTIAKKIITDQKTNQSLDNDRIFVFNYDEFKDIGNGKQYHIVGYVGDGSGETTPVAHYELHFIEAPPILIDDLINKSDIHKERTYAYMNYYYDRAGLVDFDGNPETNPNVVGHEAEYYSTEHWYDAPTSPANNMTYVPFQWDDIQYGFCYPKLTPTIKDSNPVGAAPDHGDYIVLKSMNDTNASPNDRTILPYGYGWWNGQELYDYTYYLTKSTDVPLQYGSFLYTDASDEARSIATIPFNASLCNGSSIYFTAFVADKTNGYIYPQLLIRIVGIREDGTRERIMAFHTGILDKQVGVSQGQWYQIYSASTMPTNFDPSITHFEAEIINYACGATGADFAIDQIVIYTSNTKVLLTQTSKGDCKEEEENTVKIYMEAEGLQSAFNIDEEKPQPIYWRVCEEGTNNVVKAPGMYPRYSCTYNEETGEYMISEEPEEDDDGTNEYGIVYVYVKSNYSKDDEKQETDLYGWYYDEEEGKYFFQIADKSFEWLERGKNYYVSVYSPQGNIEENDPADWGNPVEICSIYSEFFIPRRQYVTYIVPETDGEEGGDLMIECGSTGATVTGVKMVLKVPDDSALTGFVDKEISFDYAFFDKTKWGANEPLKEDTEYTYAELMTALKDYREKYKDKKDVGLNEEYNTLENEKNYAVLKYAVENGILELANSTTFTHTFDKVGTHYVLCIPIEPSIDGKDICGPFEVAFKLTSSSGPSLTLGFEDVTTYPKGNRVVRVGLKQLNNMQTTNGYLLHIPVNTFKTNDKATSKEGTLVIDGNLELQKHQNGDGQTNDDDWTDNVDVATFVDPEISKNKMYISVNFHGLDTKPSLTFKEGFTYRMFFQVKDKEKANDNTACDAGVEFLMKVVPEFVTWNDGSVTGTNKNINKNWNRDENWSRSKREELHKGETNTGSEGHPDGYKDNGDLKIASTPAAFVPMKFTYVTIPSNNVAPKLVDLKTTDESKGIYTNINDVEGENDANNKATDNIEYDLMVRYTEETCRDHGISGDVYDCEKFYGNWAKEIYFKPEAELVNQHYLTYEKVWVEKELTANTWTLMSTPLQNTYAGDMYVPFANGKQTTEAFQTIEFNTTTYSRTLYPIYQRSWAQSDSKVYTKTNDVRASWYSANIIDGVDEKFTQWSHTYNDVQVEYSDWKGFAIRAHKQDGKPEALLRLPKEDTQYDYYQWDGNMPTDGKLDAQAVNKKANNDDNHLATGKLFTDNTFNTYGVTYGVKYANQERTAGNGDVTETANVIQNVENYVLVGNPYLCSIDMSKFLEVNYNDGTGSLAENGYWTYNNNVASAKTTTGVIGPLQSFFVKAKAAASEIKFTPAMMTDGNSPEANNGSRMFALTASNDRGQSVANVSVGEEAKSVETLFDSNLADVPMVYTVADGQAVSINQVTELDKPIAFGVTCAATDEPVTVTFSNIAQLTSGEVYVVDAVTGEQTAIAEGSTITVQPNDYGRYFLLAGALNIDESVNVQQGIVVSVRGRVVTVASGEVLTEVCALSPDGATVQQATAGSTRTSLTLSTPGVYIIKAANVAGEQQTIKVSIKAK